MELLLDALGKQGLCILCVIFPWATQFVLPVTKPPGLSSSSQCEQRSPDRKPVLRGPGAAAPVKQRPEEATPTSSQHSTQGFLSEQHLCAALVPYSRLGFEVIAITFSPQVTSPPGSALRRLVPMKQSSPSWSKPRGNCRCRKLVRPP